MLNRIEAGAKTVVSQLGLSPDWQWQSTILSETPGVRMVTRYLFHEAGKNSQPDRVETVGKFYSDNETGAQCYQAMRSLYRILAKQDSPVLAIPAPPHYSAENSLLSLQWLAHRPYSELVNRHNYRLYLRRAGKALANLHQLPVNFGQVKNLDDHLSELINPHPLHLAKLLPEQAGRILNIVERLGQIERTRFKKIRPVPVHRDFHLRQMFCDQNKVWLIDWDLYSLGDPALDVGNFLVYLETHLPAKSASAGNAFLAGYRSLIPNIEQTNIKLYMAFTYLRLACKAHRLQLNDWEDRIARYLSECEQLLSIGKGVQ